MPTNPSPDTFMSIIANYFQATKRCNKDIV
jgi:hypothetical protein